LRIAMAKFAAEDYHAEELQEDLAARGFKHLRVRRRGGLLTIESGSKTDPVPRARLRRDAVHLWILEMPTQTERWELTPFRAQLSDLLELLTTQFSWALAPLEPIPSRTSGRKY
jgi:hypothetical protein